MQDILTKLNAIAIDGPVASGKTVVGTLLAKQLEWRFLDTGFMYRGITWAALNKSIDLNDEKRLTTLAYQTSITPLSSETGNRLLIDEEDVTDQLRSPEVESVVSIVAKVGPLRVALVEKQRQLAIKGKIVMMGRDIGTVVLPDAILKIFLTASIENRVERRHNELINSGRNTTYNKVLLDLRKRDQIDTERLHSPLKYAKDSIEINTDELTIHDTINKIVSLLKEQ